MCAYIHCATKGGTKSEGVLSGCTTQQRACGRDLLYNYVNMS